MLTAGDPVWDPLFQGTLDIGLLHTVSFHLLPHLQQPELSSTTTDIHMLNSLDTLCLPETPVTLLTQPCLFSSFGFHDNTLPITSHYLLPFRLLFLRCSYWDTFQEALPLTAGFTLSESTVLVCCFSQFISFLRRLFHAWSFYWHANNPDRRLCHTPLF